MKLFKYRGRVKPVAISLLILSALVTGAALAATGSRSTSRATFSVRSAQTTEEGQVVVFTVSLAHRAAHTAKVHFATVAGTAGSGNDFVRQSGTLVFKRGQRQKTVRIAVVDDSSAEDTESFSLRLSHPQGARIGTGTATVAIGKSDLPAPFTLHSTMDGSYESGDDPTAHGTASFTLDASAEQASWTVTLEGVTEPFGFLHIHSGRPPNLPLALWEVGDLVLGNGTYSGSKHLGLASILGLYRNPGGYWAQLHKNNAHPEISKIGGPITAG
jgi:hypothetical protein